MYVYDYKLHNTGYAFITYTRARNYVINKYSSMTTLQLSLLLTLKVIHIQYVHRFSFSFFSFCYLYPLSPPFPRFYRIFQVDAKRRERLRVVGFRGRGQG